MEIGRWKREALKSELMDAIHGQRVEIIPDEFPEWYFDGRAVVSFDEIDAYKMKVVIEVDAKPFRFAVNETEVTISAGDMWTQQTIYFGRGTENQGSNSIFYFGSSSRNTFDFSSLLRLNFSWIDAPSRANPVIQLNDTYGHTYQKNAAVTGPTGYDSIELDNIGTVDASKIWRVLVSGIGRVDMYGVPSGATYFGQIHNDRMPVVPYFESHFENDIDVMLNGVGATISPGNNYIPELRLREGENDLYVYDLEATSSEYIVVRYREGRL